VNASVIVVAHAGTAYLEDSLPSLAGYAAAPDTEVILVDNGGRCGGGVQRWPGVRVVTSTENLGFAGGVRLGVEAAQGEVLALLNDDAAAAPGWLEAHLEVLCARPEVAATAGRLTTLDGSRHDFVRGAVTFDAHAFQTGQGRPVGEVPPPETGEALPFACGGNMSIRRRDWDRCGGFDPALFAYFEDVELGWRLWAMGRQVAAAPGAVARHRGAATSSRLGNFRRGVLFERNALRTFFACADDQHRGALGPAVLATFLRRLVHYAADEDLAHLTADPFGVAPPPPDRRRRWRRRLDETGVVGAVRHLLARLVGGPRVGRPVLDQGYLLMQLRAAHGFFAGLDGCAVRRSGLEAAREIPDRELLARFPRLVVPTYPGDDDWFASPGFGSLLPADWPLDFCRLDELLHAGAR
jgi:GT2 family glycosyltransferase